MTDSCATYLLAEKVALIKMDDGKANALSHEMIDALHGALDQAEADQARAVVLVGRPGRFCAGFDLQVMKSGEDAMRELVRSGAGLLLRLYTFGMPVVMACTGHALAAGAVMLLAGDHCVGGLGGFKIGLNEVRIGLPVPIFALELARDRLERRHFTAATCFARIYDDEGALEAGYLHQLVPTEDVQETAMVMARSLAKGLKRGAFARTRRNARNGIALLISQTLDEDLAQLDFG